MSQHRPSNCRFTRVPRISPTGVKNKAASLRSWCLEPHDAGSRPPTGLFPRAVCRVAAPVGFESPSSVLTTLEPRPSQGHLLCALLRERPSARFRDLARLSATWVNNASSDGSFSSTKRFHPRLKMNSVVSALLSFDSCCCEQVRASMPAMTPFSADTC